MVLSREIITNRMRLIPSNPLHIVILFHYKLKICYVKYFFFFFQIQKQILIIDQISPDCTIYHHLDLKFINTIL